jgi:allantoate deiminase
MDGAAILKRLDDLAAISADGPGALTRLYLTPEHRRAAELVASWMREAGMNASIDAAGSVVGRYEGFPQDAPALLIGSHIDTVRNAGKYDGNLGVVLGIEAVRRIALSGRRLSFAIEVLAFGDEEGVRFPVTLTTSRAIAGSFDPKTLEARDQDGVSMREALVAFGGDPDGVAALARNPARTLGYVEVHIEQGPVLEDNNLPVGIVTAIAGATRASVEVKGFAGHAGTVPMALRKDAGAAAAEMTLAVEQIARYAGDVVATVGQMRFLPGAVNVVPGGAAFTLDIRSARDEARNKALSAIASAFADIAARRGVSLEMKTFYDEPAAVCSQSVIAGLEAATRAEGITSFRLPSGAGHDGMSMVSLCQFGMLFVRCKGGVSHNPAESVTARDVEIAANVLTRFVEGFAKA